MSKPVGLDCPHCKKTIVASFDVTKDVEINCPHCGSVIVAPRNGGEPFVKVAPKEPLTTEEREKLQAAIKIRRVDSILGENG